MERERVAYQNQATSSVAHPERRSARDGEQERTVRVARHIILGTIARQTANLTNITCAQKVGTRSVWITQPVWLITAEKGILTLEWL